jgi:hypothetical protein
LRLRENPANNLISPILRTQSNRYTQLSKLLLLA